MEEVKSKRNFLTIRVSVREKKIHHKEAEALGLDEAKLLNVYKIIGRSLIAKQTGVNLEDAIENDKAKLKIKSFISSFLLLVDIPEKEKKEIREMLEDLKK